ncbi:MAG: M1 family metallopeptidase [Candidatus Solibacter usitatus]|nr:M1 family metallopeptidase [Candidatus Solibacter usitatus]
MRPLRGVIAVSVGACLALLSSCSSPDAPLPEESGRDIHTFSEPEKVRVKHIDLDLDALFDRKILKGTATLTVEKAASSNAPLILDSRDLSIEKVEVSSDGSKFTATTFEFGKPDPFLGSALTIPLAADSRQVRVQYATSPNASGLQWLDPPQTAGKRMPFLYTQSQAIHARSWIPLQDTPGVRFTYTARVRTPKNLLAIMSAEDNPIGLRTGEYAFRMPLPVPSYLLALAIGDLTFQSVSRRTGVYAEKPVIAEAAKEFEDTEKMLTAAEELFGPYRWGRYDILVAPPSFPLGGMENPRLTFVTSAVIAGDKSLVSQLTHEMAHSWSGNVVTYATWSDFWLSEGFTVYIERRIIERVYGLERAEMQWATGRQDLEAEMARLSSKDQMLRLDLRGRDAEAAFTLVPFEKGALFLLSLEQAFGRNAFDAFLRGYFDYFAFQSITTRQFLEYLRANLLSQRPELAAQIQIEKWAYQPGLPSNAPQLRSAAFLKVEQQAALWLQGKATASELDTEGWNTQQWIHFLRYLTPVPDADKMRELDEAFGFTKSGNAEISGQWLLKVIRRGYEPAYPRLEQFLTTEGGRRYLRPLYEELMKAPGGRARARAIYAKARPMYHPTARAVVDEIVKK